MNLLGFIAFAVIFGLIGAFLGTGGMTGGMVLGGLFIICSQLEELINLLKEQNCKKE